MAKPSNSVLAVEGILYAYPIVLVLSLLSSKCYQHAISDTKLRRIHVQRFYGRCMYWLQTLLSTILVRRVVNKQDGESLIASSCFRVTLVFASLFKLACAESL